MKKIPKRIFSSPLLEYANFDNGGSVNLIRLNKPYANGDSYAVTDTVIEIPTCLWKMFKTHSKAVAYFYKEVKRATHVAGLAVLARTENKIIMGEYNLITLYAKRIGTSVYVFDSMSNLKGEFPNTGYRPTKATKILRLNCFDWKLEWII